MRIAPPPRAGNQPQYVTHGTLRTTRQRRHAHGTCNPLELRAVGTYVSCQTTYLASSRKGEPIDTHRLDEQGGGKEKEDILPSKTLRLCLFWTAKEGAPTNAVGFSVAALSFLSRLRVRPGQRLDARNRGALALVVQLPLARYVVAAK